MFPARKSSKYMIKGLHASWKLSNHKHFPLRQLKLFAKLCDLPVNIYLLGLF
jgi:hypothetical protein